MEEIIEYECIRNDYSSDYKSEYDENYEGHKHRELVKIIINCCQEYYGEFNVKLMFIAIDLLKRTDSSLTSKNLELRTFNAYVCIYLAAKLMNVNNFTIDEFCKNIIPQEIGNFDKEKFQMQEFEITRLTKGCYLDLYLYKKCRNFDQLYETFYNVIMSQDCELYKNIDQEDWFNKLKEISDENEMIETSINTFFSQ